MFGRMSDQDDQLVGMLDMVMGLFSLLDCCPVLFGLFIKMGLLGMASRSILISRPVFLNFCIFSVQITLTKWNYLLTVIMYILSSNYIVKTFTGFDVDISFETVRVTFVWISRIIIWVKFMFTMNMLDGLTCICYAMECKNVWKCKLDC